MFDFGVGLKDPVFFVGVVENNIDPRKEGRVQVRAFGVHGTNSDVPTDMLPWAIVVQGDYNPNNIPKINSWVFGVFLDSRDAQQPMVLGLIPTQMTEPLTPDSIKKQGWGVIPDRDSKLLAQGSEPESFGQPQNSRLARGEKIEETKVFQQEMARKKNVKVGGKDETWDEPGTAYNAEYPFNKVIETGAHTIELDDTPGAERIMIHHGSGSFVQIDTRGTVTEKAVSDKFEVMDRKQHVVVGGMSTVTIEGNSYVYVKGNKIEEIEGDLQTLVHGNHMLSVGGQSTINASDQAQMRGADVKIEANVGTMAINANKEMQIQAGKFGNPYGALSIKSEKILVDATDKLHLRGNTQVNVQSVVEMNFSALTINQLSATWSAQASLTTTISSALTTDITGGIDVAIGGGVQTNINSPIVNIDNFVNLAGGLARPAIPSLVAAKFTIPPIPSKAFIPTSPIPEIAWGAATVFAPEPVNKSTALITADLGSMGSTGYNSIDHKGETRTLYASNVIASVSAGAAAPLLDFIGDLESNGYDDISGLVSKSRYPAKKLTDMTIQEVLDWQESIDSKQSSEAAGRYQIMEDTLRGYNNDNNNGPGRPLYKRAGLSASDKFSAANQDKLAIALLKTRGLDSYLKGKISREKFAYNLACEWASLPLVTGPNAGKSRYDSNTNKSLTKVKDFLQVLDKVKSSYSIKEGTALAQTITPGGNIAWFHI